ncbi:FxsA family protein [Vitiosangium sp. GDMCC 1.1324]|uniref:FxsA family protein n=1 Tax=Vitiosangium sp. (strain GDMCC 1.1324) TaxID=2138576 RepID=UPI000D39ACDF|nr:FxsA family protein [Vitiosangium sp. GDMCC 1.1324]PTL77848.1 exlusion protein FxsA [Vitiosangium sp. GDMCC 1.1324]
MFKYLFLAFVVVPFVDLYLLLAIGREVGLWPTVGLVLASGLFGSFLARKEGVRVLRRWQESVAQGLVPQEGLLSGVLVLAGGVLLVIPGVLTDVAGLVLLFPPTRRLVARMVRRRLERGMAEGSVRVTTFQSGPFPGGPFETPQEDEPFAPRPSWPRLERRPGDEVDAEFTEEDGPGRG